MMWFIFNLQRKYKQFEIAAADINRYMQNRLRIKRTAYVSLSAEHLLELCSCKLAQTQIFDIFGLMSLGYWHLLGQAFNKSDSVDPSGTSRMGLPWPQFQFPVQAQFK